MKPQKTRIFFSLVLLLIVNFQVSAGTQKRTNARGVSNEQETIVIWKVGSPYEGDTPENTLPFDMRLLAKQAGYQLRMESFPAVGFAQKFFDAILANKEPDILAFDNYGIMEGISTAKGSVVGIATSTSIRNRLVNVSESFEPLEAGRGGWQYLITSSRNHAKARALALQEVGCDSAYAGNMSELPASSIDEVKKLGLAFGGAFYAADRLALNAYANGRYPAESLTFNRSKKKILRSTVCGIWANERLAFVSHRVFFETEKALGQERLLFVLKKEAGWNLALITDSWHVMKELSAKMPPFLAATPPPTNLSVPNILAPAGGTRFKRGETGEIQWTNTGAEAAVYLLEWQFGQTGGVDWSGSGFSIIQPQHDATLPNKVVAPRKGAQPHRFRIWAVAPNGEVQISGWRTIDYGY